MLAHLLSRRAWRRASKPYGVSIGGAASSADLGCSSEYSNGYLKTEAGKGSASTAVGRGSLGN